MRLSDLQDKEVINIHDGSNIGRIIDVVVDSNGSMQELVVQKNKWFSFFASRNEVEIKWNQIKKIGEDVILVNIGYYE